MFAFLNVVRGTDFLSVLLKMTTAVICGGMIGLERENKRRPAGFRTHILICLGASMTTLTGEYLLLNAGLYTDVSRLGAQVIAGMGFIGAGTIIVTHLNRVKGLTTAAGLWTSAIIGLACGAGYYECALFAAVLVAFVEIVMCQVEYRCIARLRDVVLYVKYSGAECLERFVEVLKDSHVKLLDIEITKSGTNSQSSAIITIHLTKNCNEQEMMKHLNEVGGVLSLEEL